MLRLILVSFTALLTMGCEDIILEDNNTTDVTEVDSLPKKYTIVGDPVELEDYLHPSLLEIDKNIYIDLYPYNQDNNGKITNKAIKEKSFTKTEGDVNTKIITEFVDNKKITSDYITQDKIKRSIDNKIVEEYPKTIYTNSILTEVTNNNTTKLCVIKYIGKKDLLPLLPTYIQNDIKQYISIDQFNLDNILHVECRTTDNISTNIYYSKIYGEVLNIEKNTTSDIMNYEIIDPKSVEAR